MKCPAFIKHLLLVLGISFSSASLHAQLKNNHLFKVDPAGALFHEMRCIYESRIRSGEFFWLISPYFHHQNALSADQKSYGAGFRLGLRKYFAWKRIMNQSPQGLFFQPHIGYRFTSVTRYGDELQILSKNLVHQPCVGFTGGYQWLYGRKDNLAYGIRFGLEYMLFIPHDKNAISVDDVKENWYQFPIAGEPGFLKPFRLYLGFEVGFAFRQKNLHW